MTARNFILHFCLFAAATSAVRAETLAELMARMDAASATFTGMTASLKQLDHQEILGENETQTALVKLKKSKAGLVARLDFAAPNQHTVSLRSRTVEVFTPKSNTVQIYDIGKFGSQLDQFLLLGFGTSGKELQKNYDVKLIGAATVGDRKTTHIELVPKSKQALEYLKKAELWIAVDGAYPIQEKVHKNATDYFLINYSDVKINAPLADQDLEMKLPAGVTKIYPNK